MASTSTRTETIVSEGLFDRDESETVSVAEPEPHQLRLETTVDLGEIIDRPEEGKYFWTTGNDPGVEHVQIIDWGGTGEVHAMYDKCSGETFARKLMKAFGDVRPEDIQNEIRAVDKLCKSSTHPNIVPVLKHGHMHPHYYFMDMELCDLNLESYMHQKWTAALEEKTPYFTNDLPLWMKTRQVWGIMEDIIRGVAFIHLNKEVHRDLKPQNILYSYRDHTWKIADFGITSEGTSGRAYTTNYSRGSSGYRAPELIKEDRRTYSNKVDIWAMGCIFYELIFKEKAFATDSAVDQYSKECLFSGNTLQLPFKLDTLADNGRKTFVNKMICDMLEVDAQKRPRAEELNKRFMIWNVLSAPRIASSGKSVLYIAEVKETEASDIALMAENEKGLNEGKSAVINEHGPNEITVNGSAHKASTITSPKLGRPISRAACLTHQDFVAVNTLNTRLVTVTSDWPDRLQQLWEAGTGALLWEQAINYDRKWEIWPSFSCDGHYIGFHDGVSNVATMDTDGLTVLQMADFDVKFLGSHMSTFTVRPGGLGLAIAVPQGTTEDPVLKNKALHSNIDIVPYVGNPPYLRYVPDGGSLFVVQSTSKGIQSAVNVDIFDLNSGKSSRCFQVDAVSEYSVICGTLHSRGLDCLVLEGGRIRPGKRKLGFLWRGPRMEEHCVWLLSPQGLVADVGHVRDGSMRHIVVFEGKVIYISGDGRVQVWDGEYTETLPSVAPFNNRWNVVAFDNRRITLLSKEGKFHFINSTTKILRSM